MQPTAGPSVTLVLPPDGAGVRVVDGSLVERSGNALSIAVDAATGPATLTAGEAIVVVVHDQPAEVLLAIGLAADRSDEPLRLRVVERRV
jgi:hypothetical protein